MSPDLRRDCQQFRQRCRLVKVADSASSTKVPKADIREDRDEPSNVGKGRIVRITICQIPNSSSQAGSEDKQRTHPRQKRKTENKNALKKMVQPLREPFHCTFNIVQFVQAE